MAVEHEHSETVDFSYDAVCNSDILPEIFAGLEMGDDETIFGDMDVRDGAVQSIYLIDRIFRSPDMANRRPDNRSFYGDAIAAERISTEDNLFRAYHVKSSNLHTNLKYARNGDTVDRDNTHYLVWTDTVELEPFDGENQEEYAEYALRRIEDAVDIERSNPLFRSVSPATETH